MWKSEILETIIWRWTTHLQNKPDQRDLVTVNKRCASSSCHRCLASSLHLGSCFVTEALAEPRHGECHQNSPEISHLKEEFGSWIEKSKAWHYHCFIQLPQPVSLLSYVISSCWHIASTVIISLKQIRGLWRMKAKQIFTRKPWLCCVVFTMRKKKVQLSAAGFCQTCEVGEGCWEEEKNGKSLIPAWFFCLKK